MRAALAAMLMLGLGAVATSWAAIIGSTGQVTQIPAPASVDFGALESNSTMFAFDEQQAATVGSPVCVDITAPGTYDESTDLTPGVIPTGAKVASHFVHADKVGKKKPAIHYAGSITTDADIIGIAVTDKCLDQTDVLGAAGTIYPTGKFGRAVNFDKQHDVVIQQVDNRTVSVVANVRAHADQVRVITELPACRKEEDSSDDDTGGDDDAGGNGGGGDDSGDDSGGHSGDDTCGGGGGSHSHSGDDSGDDD
jgi:hypothetical protein